VAGASDGRLDSAGAQSRRSPKCGRTPRSAVGSSERLAQAGTSAGGAVSRVRTAVAAGATVGAVGWLVRAARERLACRRVEGVGGAGMGAGATRSSRSTVGSMSGARRDAAGGSPRGTQARRTAASPTCPTKTSPSNGPCGALGATRSLMREGAVIGGKARVEGT
jgi:hypothetical protein